MPRVLTGTKMLVIHVYFDISVAKNIQWPFDSSFTFGFGGIYFERKIHRKQAGAELGQAQA